MYIFLILWFLFLLAYISYNVYAFYRVSAMRLKGDATNRVMVIYFLAIAAIIFISVIWISRLSWGGSILSFFQTGGY